MADHAKQPLATHASAARVFGQLNFTLHAGNSEGESAASLLGPSGLALAAHGDLFAADTGNGRVLMVDRPLALLPVFRPLIRR